MKKQSSFKMKGFSGFGSSPAKNVLDTKIKDIPKKAKKVVKKSVDRLKNMTVRDMFRINPVYRALDNRRRRKDASEAFVEGAGGGAAEALGRRSLMSQKMRKIRKPDALRQPQIKIKTMPKKRIKKLPVKPKMRFNQFSN
tara:strand:+ start:284 stop:703 length:420 start_codon:yes stop_codon:yes gene_type:complete